MENHGTDGQWCLIPGAATGTAHQRFLLPWSQGLDVSVEAGIGPHGRRK